MYHTNNVVWIREAAVPSPASVPSIGGGRRGGVGSRAISRRRTTTGAGVLNQLHARGNLGRLGIHDVSSDLSRTFSRCRNATGAGSFGSRDFTRRATRRQGARVGPVPVDSLQIRRPFANFGCHIVRHRVRLRPPIRRCR